MPVVDFTLEDIAKQTEGIVERALERSVESAVERSIENSVESAIRRALIKEREHTRVMVHEIVQDVVVTEFTSFWEDNLSPVLGELTADVRGLKKDMKRLVPLVDQHSRDIMELRIAIHCAQTGGRPWSLAQVAYVYYPLE